MRKVLRVFGSGIAITLMLALAMSLVLWFLGAFLGFGAARPLEGATARIVAVGITWIVALIVILLILLRRQRRDTSMAEDIVNTAEPASVEDEIVSGELGEMRDKLKAAMVRLRKSKMGRRHLYELPWYIIIGPPGAGKTTAIVNSGLNFPLADEVGKTAIGGVGGTRNCDWWFTDGAVLVDTAGRYTTQESDATADNAAWLGFLGILKKHRKRQPINGAIVAISLSDLSMQDELTQKNHAAAVRRRLHELREKLGVRFPVYVLFTKADLLAGFQQTFEGLGKEDRGQVWGFTLPLLSARDETSPMARFDSEYAALVDRLNAQSLERVQAETDPARRSLIAGFPAQVASVRSVARDFLSELFQDNRYEHRHMLRGVYFTSGTQEGTPIDRLMMGMARTFGIGRQAIGSGQGTGRSFFLTRLFSGVIFRESGLVSADDRVERRYRWSRRGALAATLLLAVGAGTVWTRAFLGNRALAAQVTQEVAAYREAEAQLPGSPISDTDLPLVVPVLNRLRDLPIPEEAPERLGWGLYQGDVLATQAAQSYRAALNQHFLPRLLLRLEEQMTGNINNPELLFEALKIYLMLGLVGPMNTDLVKEWMQVDWQLAYGGSGREDLQQDLASHLDALLGQPMDRIALNSDLVDRVQQILAEMPQAQRVYNGILNSPAAIALPKFRLTDIGGPNLSRAIVRSSGAPLTEGIDGIYTYDGFNDVFLAEVLTVAERIQRDSFVLGPHGQTEQSPQALMNLSRDVLDLYSSDFIAAYETLLGDIDIIPLQSLAHAVEVTNVLSGPTSPIVNILTGLAKQTALTAPPEGSETAEGAEAGAEAVGAQLLRRKLSVTAQTFLSAMSAAQPGTEPPPPPGSKVEEHFEWLHRLVQGEEGLPSELGTMIDLLGQVHQELNRLNFQGGLAQPAQGEVSALTRFQQQAAELPGPMQRWAAQIGSGSTGITVDNARSGLNAQWQANILPFCEAATAGKYPFDRRGAAEISMQDFTRLFGPGGMLDQFFQENLAKFVDIRSNPWTSREVGGVDLGLSPENLKQMQNAFEIRQAFFPTGGDPQVNFQLTPEALDPSAQSITLEVDGNQIGFRNGSGQPRPTAMSWPGSVGIARVTYQPPAAASESALGFDGPWALFRLLDAAEIRRTNVPDRKRVIFNVGGRVAIFQMQSGSVLNPFALEALGAFSCPKTF